MPVQRANFPLRSGLDILLLLIVLSSSYFVFSAMFKLHDLDSRGFSSLIINELLYV